MLLKELVGVAALVYDTCAITVGYVCGACGSAFWSSIPLGLLLFFWLSFLFYFFSSTFGAGCCVFTLCFQLLGGYPHWFPFMSVSFRGDLCTGFGPSFVIYIYNLVSPKKKT